MTVNDLIVPKETIDMIQSHYLADKEHSEIVCLILAHRFIKYHEPLHINSYCNALKWNYKHESIGFMVKVLAQAIGKATLAADEEDNVLGCFLSLVTKKNMGLVLSCLDLFEQIGNSIPDRL